MLAPVTLNAAQPSQADAFTQLLHAARFEALTILRSLMHAGADDATPAAVLRERRLAASAILRVPCEPAKQSPASQQPIASPVSPAHAPAPIEQRLTPRSESEPSPAPQPEATAGNTQRAATPASSPAPQPFKPRRGATPIASLRRRSGAPHANPAESG